MLHWLHSLLPHIPHYGYVLVFIVVFLNNIAIPLPGETILLGAGFVFGKMEESLWEPIAAGTAASFLGGICAFWLGRRMGQGNLKKLPFLHLAHKKLKWPERYFERHGAKAVFIARFILIFPPFAANLLAGMTKMRWPPFFFYNLTGSAAYSTTYILIGYFFGKRWKLLQAWLGPTWIYLIGAAAALIMVGVIFRRPLTRVFVRCFSKIRSRG